MHLSPTCPGSTVYFCCQPRVTGLVLQELPGLDIKACAYRAHAMPLAAPQLTLSMTDLSCSGPVRLFGDNPENLAFVEITLCAGKLL